MWHFAGIGAVLFLLTSTAQAQLSDTLLPVVRNRNWGYINTQGHEIIPCQYEAALYWGSGQYGKVKWNGTWYVLMRNGQRLELPETGDLRLLNDSIWLKSTPDGDIPCAFNGKSAFHTAPGAYIDAHGLFFRFSKEGKMGLAHVQRGILIPAHYDALHWDEFPFIRTENCGFIGMCDTSGQSLLEPEYTSIQKRSNALLAVWYGDALKVGLYHTSEKKWLLKPEYDQLEALSDAWVIMERDEKKGIFYIPSKSWYREWFKEIQVQSKHMYATNTSNHMGMIDEKGNQILEFAWQSIVPVLDVYVCSDSLGEHWFAQNGNPLFGTTAFQEHIRMESPNLLLKSLDNTYVLINAKGKLLEKNIEDPMVFKDRIKWYSGKGMQSIILNAKGEIEDQNSYTNVVRLQVQTVQARRQNTTYTLSPESSRENAASDGWFYDESLRLYGLRSKDGTLLIQPSFAHVLAIPNTPYFTVYKKSTEARDFKAEWDYGKTGMLAGLVNGITGDQLLSCAFTDILTTGPDDNKVFFALETNGTYRHYMPQKREFGAGFISVEASNQLPVRGLVMAKSLKAHNAREIGIIQSIKFQIRNPGLRYNRNTDNQFSFQPSSAQYMYVWPEKDGIRKYRENRLFGNFVVVSVRDLKTGRWGIISKNEDYIQEPKYNQIITQYLPNGAATFTLKLTDTVSTLVAANGDRWGVPGIEEIRFASEYPLIIKTDKGWHILDSLGTLHILTDVTEARAFCNGRAAVKKGSYWTFITPNGTPLGSEIFSKVFDFRDGYTMVRKGKHWMRMNTWGDLEEPLPWRSMRPAGPLWISRDAKGYVVCDAEGKRLEHIPNIQQFAWDEDSRTLLLRRANQYYWLNEQGELLSQGRNDQITLPGAHWLAENGKRSQRLHSKTGIERKIKGHRSVTDICGKLWVVRHKGQYMLCDSLLKPLHSEAYQKLQRVGSWYLAYRQGQHSVLDSTANVVFQSSNTLIWYYGDWFGETDYDRGIILRNLRSGRHYATGANQVKPVAGHGFWICNPQGFHYLDTQLRPHFEKSYPSMQWHQGMALVQEYQMTGLCDAWGRFVIGMHYPELKSMEASRFIAGEYGDSVEWFRADGSQISNTKTAGMAQKPE